MKYKDLDGSVLLNEVEFSMLKTEARADEVKERLQRARMAKAKLVNIVDVDERTCVAEDKECHEVVANRIALTLGEDNYKKYGLDREFNMSYTELRVSNGLTEYPNTKKYTDDTDVTDDDDDLIEL